MVLGPGLMPVTPSAGFDGVALVEGWWSSTTSGSGTVVPDGAVDLVWVGDRPPFVAGPDVEPRAVELPAGLTVIGLRLRTGVAPALLGQGLDRIIGDRVGLGQVCSRSELDRLDDAVGRAGVGHPAAVSGALAGAVQRLVPSGWRPDHEVEAAIATLRAGGPVEPIDVGPRQLRRRFAAAVGYGPALYRRIARLDRFTDLLERHPDRGLAELAFLAGYHDQAHLGRDCRRLLAATPGQLRAGR